MTEAEENKNPPETTSEAEEAAAAVGTETLKEAQDPSAEWKAKVAYLSAEIENMRKRFARDKSDIIRLANESLIKSLLPVLDNLHLAVDAAKKQSETEHPIIASLLKGVEMTLKHFEQTLEQVGVQTIPSVGQGFDPSVHEALSQASQADFKDNEVVGELQKGFSLNGRVLRTAKVVVNKVQN